MFLASILYSAILIGQNSPQVSPPTATPVRPPSVKANSKKSLNFDNDVRLKVKTTLKANEMTHVSLWEHIAFKAKVKIEREAAANEFDDSPLVLCCNDVSIHDLMDSVAARVLARWETIPKGYRFLVSSNELDFAYMPKDEKQREFFRKGMAFAKEIQKLPQETQQRFAVGESVPYGSFNPAMQSFVRDLAHSIGEDVLANAAPGSRLGVDITDLSDAGMKVVKVPAEGFDSYNITFSKPGMSGTFSVNNYEQRRAEGMQPGVKGGAGSLYAPKKHDLKHEDAKERPLLKKVVSIQIRNTTLPQVLRKLNLEYNLNFVCDPISAFPQLATIDFKGITLGEALDRLTELYPKTEWELRKSNILVYRSATNPANDPDKGHDEAISTTIEK